MSLLTDNPASSVKLPGYEWLYWICMWIWSDDLGKWYWALECESEKHVGDVSPFLNGKDKDMLSVY